MNVCSGNMVKIWIFIGHLVTIVKIAVPILLIVMGSIDFMKAVMAGKEDEIKKNQSTFVKRAIAAVIVYFIPTVVGLMLTLIEQDSVKNENCFICVTNPSGEKCEAAKAAADAEANTQ